MYGHERVPLYEYNGYIIAHMSLSRSVTYIVDNIILIVPVSSAVEEEDEVSACGQHPHPHRTTITRSNRCKRTINGSMGFIRRTDYIDTNVWFVTNSGQVSLDRAERE